MKYRHITILLMLIYTIFSHAQQQVIKNIPVTFNQNWKNYWTVQGNHFCSLDSIHHHLEKYALCIKGNGNEQMTVLSMPPQAVSTEKRAILSLYAKVETSKDSLIIVLSSMDKNEMKLVKSKDWKRYQLELPLSSNSQMVISQIASMSNGSCWIDSINLKMEKIVYPADMDNTFDCGSNIKFGNISTIQKHHLELLGKVWGYLKYYHPAVTNGMFNWDYELFRWLPEILEAKSLVEFEDIILQKVRNLGAFELLKPSYPNPQDSAIHHIPDFSWMNEIQKTTPALYLLLDSLKYANRTNTIQYYNRVMGGSKNIFPNEKAYQDRIMPDAGFRLLSLFRYWNIVNYFYPYIHSTEWNKVLREYIPAFISAKDTETYRKLIDKLGTELKDSHAEFSRADSLLPHERKPFYLPCHFDYIENQVIVSEVLDSTVNLKTGDIIMGINGRKIKKCIKDFRNRISSSNERSYLVNLCLLLNQVQNKENTLEIRREGKKIVSYIEGIDETTYWNIKRKLFGINVPCNHFIQSDIGYFSPIGNFMNDSISFIMKKFEHCKSIIIDMRNYPNSYMGNIADYLFPKAKACTRTTSVIPEYPGVFRWDNSQIFGKENPNYYKGKIIVLINEKTVSMGESIVTVLQQAPNCTLIGSPTSGTDGTIAPFYLPGGIHTKFTGIGFYYADKRRIQNKGIQPDITVKPTIKSTIQGRDEILNFAIRYANEQ